MMGIIVRVFRGLDSKKSLIGRWVIGPGFKASPAFHSEGWRRLGVTQPMMAPSEKVLFQMGII
jgi:hypothetical protein